MMLYVYNDTDKPAKNKTRPNGHRIQLEIKDGTGLLSTKTTTLEVRPGASASYTPQNGEVTIKASSKKEPGWDPYGWKPGKITTPFGRAAGTAAWHISESPDFYGFVVDSRTRLQSLG